MIAKRIIRMFNYIIKGNNHKAISVKSDLNWLEFSEEIRTQTKLVHADGSDRVLNFMGVELINPQVMTPQDFANYIPFLFGMK